jgi:hypothetical protein
MLSPGVPALPIYSSRHQVDATAFLAEMGVKSWRWVGPVSATRRPPPVPDAGEANARRSNTPMQRAFSESVDGTSARKFDTTGNTAPQRNQRPACCGAQRRDAGGDNRGQQIIRSEGRGHMRIVSQESCVSLRSGEKM